MENGRVYLLEGMVFTKIEALGNRWDEFSASQTGVPHQRLGV